MLPGPHKQPAAPSPAREGRLCAFFGKMRGGLGSPPLVPPPIDWGLASVGSVLGLLSVAGVNQAMSNGLNLPLLLGSFGASATLLFGMPTLPPAQPRNVLGGMVVSLLSGLVWRTLLGARVFLAAPFAVATAIFGMQVTATLHPPGGASALIVAVMEPLHSIDPIVPGSLDFVLPSSGAPYANSWCIRNMLEDTMRDRFFHGGMLCISGMLGTVILLAVALVTNNFGPASKRYPIYWWRAPALPEPFEARCSSWVAPGV
ncbi:hypothetical protein WJX81_000093 [Elliptochloris bilobata]|uniref:HPP transmembrane region domain-containing protein n=1 Tax=Elliptochloris bilobata TaxID=381761 RepID=A0AAW1RKY9_9CHLO